MSNPASTAPVKPARGPRTYRILTLGDGAVGKTSLLRFYRGDKTPVVSTVGIDMVLADAVVRGRAMKLQIWVRTGCQTFENVGGARHFPCQSAQDTAGQVGGYPCVMGLHLSWLEMYYDTVYSLPHILSKQERFRSIVVSYLRNCHGVLVCYDVTRRATFLAVRSWLDALISLEPQAVAVLCACKADVDAVERVVTTAEGAELARRLGVPFFESSAKTGVNVREAFHALAEELAARHEADLGGAPGAAPASGSGGHAAGDNLADRLRRLDSDASSAASDGLPVPAKGAPFKVIDDTVAGHPTAAASRSCAC